MRKIKIKKNTLGDTRTATKVPTFSEFDESNSSHVDDVSNMMNSIAEEIKSTGTKHDYTKLYEPERSLFYRELCATIEGKTDSFVDGEWYPMHCKTESSKMQMSQFKNMTKMENCYEHNILCMYGSSFWHMYGSSHFSAA